MIQEMLTPLDEARVEAFAGRLFELFANGMLTLMIDVGDRTGLFRAAAAGPGTSSELAERAGLEERYVREWLGAVVTGGIIDYEPATRTYSLPAEHAFSLTGERSANIAPLSQMQTHLGKHLHEVVRAFREGGGVPYEAFRPEFTEVMDAAGRSASEAWLIDAWLPLAPGLRDRLATGVRVADIGCGTGHQLLVLAAAFPSSEFVGYDLAEDPIEVARAGAAAAGLTNVRFEVSDAADLTVDDPFDVVFVFDAIHDQVQPDAVLARIRAALTPDGLFYMFEPRASSNLEDNVGNPIAPWLYSVSTLHCLTVSLAKGGAGLGTAWGEQLARKMLGQAGFVDIDALEVPGDPFNTVYLARKGPR